MKIIQFPEFEQTSVYDCGAKAMEAMLDYYGFHVLEKDIIKTADTTRGGTTFSGLIKVVKKYGLKHQLSKMTIDDIKKFIDKKIPVILLVQAWTDKARVNWNKDWKDGHYVVAIGYDKTNMYFEDPWTTFRAYLTFGELQKRWHAIDKAGKKQINKGLAVYGKKGSYNLKKVVKMK